MALPWRLALGLQTSNFPIFRYPCAYPGNIRGYVGSRQQPVNVLILLRYFVSLRPGMSGIAAVLYSGATGQSGQTTPRPGRDVRAPARLEARPSARTAASGRGVAAGKKYQMDVSSGRRALRGGLVGLEGLLLQRGRSGMTVRWGAPGGSHQTGQTPPGAKAAGVVMRGR